jgi:uncharacterized membrane protein YdjX (TVP38/TMEM64 family)
MMRYWTVAGTVLGLLLVGFLVGEALDISPLADPTHRLGQGGMVGAILAVALLTLDAVLPVPASLVMVASGALYGTVTGALLALLGRVLMALSGYAIGQRGGPLVARLVPPDGRDRADGLLRRWGTLAIVVTRPVPLLAETMTILAGVSEIGWARVAAAAFVGSVPEAVLYAGSGALAHSVEEAARIWVALLILTCTLWIIGRWANRRIAPVRSAASVPTAENHSETNIHHQI